MEIKNELNREEYEAPVIRIVEIRVEQGVQMSPAGEDSLENNPEDAPSSY
jgi:hypothetical protein